MLTHVTLNCATEQCYAVITLHPDEERRLRHTKETFYCPAGHSNYFPGKTDEEKKIEQLRSLLDEAHEWRGLLIEDRDLLLAREKLCPLRCGWKTDRRPLGLYRHDQGERTEGLARYFERVEQDVRDHLLTEHQALPEPRKLLTERAGV